MSYIVAIDLGSNSFRVLKYDYIKNQEIGEFDKVISMADGLNKSGNISPEAIKRIIKAIHESVEKLDYDPSKAIAITTAAMRKANNSSFVLQTIKEKTKANFQIIDGDKEADLTLLSIKNAIKRHNINSDRFLFVDIGGASSEIVIVNKDDIIKKSFDFGIVTMSQAPNPKQALKDARDEIINFIKDKNIQEFGFFATAGTPTTLAAIKQGLNAKEYDKTKVNGTVLTKEDLNHYYTLLKNLDNDSLIFLVGSRKIEFVLTGIKIFNMFYETLGFDSSVVFDDGLKEGIILEALEQINNQ